MKRTISQLDAYKSIRKPTLPPPRVELPKKGRPYTRKTKWGKDKNGEEI